MINKTITRLLAICCVVTLWSATAVAQDVWNLERCINHALQNNIDVQQGRIGIEQASINYKQAKHSRYPSLSAGTNLGLNFGRTIDPTNNEFITQSFLSNGLSFSSGITLYSAGRINNSIKQASINEESARSSSQQVDRDISLFVANTYLSALFAQENLKNAVAQLDLTKEQYNQVETLIKAGVRPANELLDLEAQIARGEQTIIAQENAVNIQMLSLKQQLLLEPSYEMVLDRPADVEIISDVQLISFDEIYKAALENQPRIRAAELNMRAAAVGEEIAKSAYYPTVGLNGSIGTNYSNRAQRFTGTGFEDIPYSEQIEENISYGFGLGVSIPIYSNYQATGGVERAKLNTMNSALNIEREKNTLKTNVQQALADAQATSKSYQAAQKSRDAQRAAYDNATKQYDLGAINSFDFVNARALLDSAEISLIIAKYDYLFKAKVVDFYMGRPISLN